MELLRQYPQHIQILICAIISISISVPTILTYLWHDNIAKKRRREELENERIEALNNYKRDELDEILYFCDIEFTSQVWHGKDRILLDAGLKYFRYEMHKARQMGSVFQKSMEIETGGHFPVTEEHEKVINNLIQLSLNKVYGDFAIFLSSLSFVKRHEKQLE